MASIRNLQFVLSGRDAGASKALDKVGNKASGLGKSLAGIGGAFAGGAAVAGIVGFGKSSVTAFQESQESAQRLQFALDKFPKLADTSAEKLGGLNEQLAKKTRFDDDALASGQAVLAQFGLTGKQLEEVTPLLADYAASTGQDLPSAASSLGKALQGNAKALKSVGINYKSTKDAGKDFTNVQKLLNDKVGGFAAKEGKTAAGQAEILRNQFGELKETVGSQLLPVVTSFVKYLGDEVVPRFQTFADQFKDGTGKGGAFKAVLSDLSGVARDMVPHIKMVAEKTGQLVRFVADHPDAFKNIAFSIAAYATAMKAAATWSAATAAVNFAAIALGFKTVGAGAAAGSTGMAAFGKVFLPVLAGLLAADKLGIINGDPKVSSSKGPQPIRRSTDADDRRRPVVVAPPSPRRVQQNNGGGLVRGGAVVVATLDTKRVTSVTSTAQQGRVSRGFLAPGY